MLACCSSHAQCACPFVVSRAASKTDVGQGTAAKARASRFSCCSCCCTSIASASCTQLCAMLATCVCQDGRISLCPVFIAHACCCLQNLAGPVHLQPECRLRPRAHAHTCTYACEKTHASDDLPCVPGCSRRRHWCAPPTCRPSAFGRPPASPERPRSAWPPPSPAGMDYSSHSALWH